MMPATVQWWFIAVLLLSAAVLGFWSPAWAISLIAGVVLIVASVSLDLRRLLELSARRARQAQEGHDVE